MKMSKEEEALLTQYASAALQGWLAHYAEESSINQVNFGVVSRGCFQMAKSMLIVHKQVVSGGIPESKEK